LERVRESLPNISVLTNSVILIFCYSLEVMKITLPHIPKKLEKGTNLKNSIEKSKPLSGMRLEGEAILGIKAGNFTASETVLEAIDASEAFLPKTDFSDVEIRGCIIIAANLPEGSWRRVMVKDSRCSGLQLHTGVFRNVVFNNCKLDLINFRCSKLKNVIFKDCVLTESDFYSAELESVSFESCQLSKAQFSGSKLKKVDLRSSQIADIASVSGLSGATIDSNQAIQLAPSLAHELKLIVED
jgi:uncharacterized protein YjbI with pentapeptide repeats